MSKEHKIGATVTVMLKRLFEVWRLRDQDWLRPSSSFVVSNHERRIKTLKTIGTTEMLIKKIRLGIIPESRTEFHLRSMCPLKKNKTDTLKSEEILAGQSQKVQGKH